MSTRALDNPEQLTERRGFAAVRPEWLAMLIVAALAACHLLGTVDPDVAWQLWIAHQVNHGAQLYHDIVEVNPPLWFWMALPIDKAATLTGLRAESVLIAAVGVLQMLSLGALSALLPMEGRRKAALLAFAALVMGAYAWIHIGQREQLALIAAVPYAALMAARRNGRQVSLFLGIAVGIGAGLGFALKHYFLIVPFLLELWLAVSQRRSWTPFRPETWAMAAVGAAYASTTLIFAPAFLSEALPLIRLGYGGSGATSFGQLFQPGLVIGLAILAMLLACWRRLDDLSSALLIAAAGFGAAYFIQAKGWHYHSIPLVGCGAIALAVFLAKDDEPPRLLGILAPVLLSLPLILSWLEARSPRLPDADLNHAIAGLPPGANVGFLATEPAFAFSVTLQHGFGYPPRYFGFWMMRSIINNERNGGPNPALTAFGHRIRRDIANDFLCHPPVRIIANRPTPARSAAGDFDILAWFEHEPDFAALMTHYRHVSRTSADTYDLARPWRAPPTTSCTRRF